jgi:hypothetical protein
VPAGGPGTRFVIRIPTARTAAAAAAAGPSPVNGAAGAPHTSTTTGRTIGRRRNRS